MTGIAWIFMGHEWTIIIGAAVLAMKKIVKNS